MTEPVAEPAPVVTTLLAGLAGGLVAGTFGVGGGILLVPVLALVLHRSQHVAHATSLVAVVLASLAGVVGFALDDAVNLPGAGALALGAVIGARLGATFLPKMTDSVLKQAFAVLLFVVALRFLLVGASAEAAANGLFVPELDGVGIALHAAGGLAAGIVSSVLGVGGGVIMVPLLAAGFGYGQQIAQGTSLAVIVPTALTGALAHHRNGYTDVPLGLRLGGAALVGSFAGSQVALALSPEVLAKMFGALLTVASLLMLRAVTKARTTAPPA